MDVSALEAALVDNPDDPAPYLVHADWLQAQGDPRGELIVLQHRGVDPAAHLAKYPELLGPLRSFERPDEKPRGRKVLLKWKLGYVDAIDIGWGMYQRGGTHAEAVADLTAILAHPSCRLLSSFEVGPMPTDDMMSFDGAVEAIVAANVRTLRELELGDIGDWDISSTSTGNFARIAQINKQLRRVRLHAGDITIGEVDLPELRTWSIETGALTKADLAQIAKANVPKLERLEIWCGQSNYGSDLVEDDLDQILNRPWPKLVKLGIMNCPWIDLAIEKLAKSPLLKQLSHLDLSMGALSSAGVDKLVEHADRFQHVKLDVSDNALDDDALPKLARFGVTELGEQDPGRVEDDDPYSRYTSVGE